MIMPRLVRQAEGHNTVSTLTCSKSGGSCGAAPPCAAPSCCPSSPGIRLMLARGCWASCIEELPASCNSIWWTMLCWSAWLVGWARTGWTRLAVWISDASQWLPWSLRLCWLGEARASVGSMVLRLQVAWTPSWNQDLATAALLGIAYPEGLPELAAATFIVTKECRVQLNGKPRSLQLCWLCTLPAAQPPHSNAAEQFMANAESPGHGQTMSPKRPDLTSLEAWQVSLLLIFFRLVSLRSRLTGRLHTQATIRMCREEHQGLRSVPQGRSTHRCLTHRMCSIQKLQAGLEPLGFSNLKTLPTPRCATDHGCTRLPSY